jgi:ATP-binding cassette, subfamily C, bacteriocin exporter
LIMKKSVKIKQHDKTDCGAACLASIASHYGLKYPISRIRQYSSTDKKGTNVLGMIEAAQKLGFTAKGVKGPFESLLTIPLPAIAHVIVKKVLHHFVVIYKITPKYVIVMDPAGGIEGRLTHNEFKEEWTGVLILLAPAETFSRGDKSVSIGRRFIELMAPHKSIMAQALFGAAIYSILGLSTSVFVQKIVDFVLVDGNLNLLHIMGIAMFVILALKVYIGSMKSFLAIKTGQKIDAVLILGYYKHLMLLPQQFFDTMRVGEIISRVNDAVKIRSFINSVSVDFVVNSLVLIFTTILMFVYSWKLALTVIVGIPFYLAIYMVYNRFNKNRLRKIMENSADLESQLVESLNSVATIKRFGVEDSANLKTETRFVKLLNTTFTSAKVSILSGNASELIAGSITISLLWFGATIVVKQEITPGTLMSFYALLGYVLSPISALINANQSLQDAMIAADRLFQIMDLELEENDDKKITLTPDIIEDIHFKNVSFRYGSRKQVFEDLSLTICKRSITAVIGESGSGKTTLMALLQNLYPLQSGKIEIGNYDIKNISNRSLRNLVGAVPQNVDLFAGTIIENIALGDMEPDMKRIVEICTLLKITEFIENLPHSYLTNLGERGVSLSGGEKQRIAIARALYKNPEVLILDEATSSLDTVSESFVKQAVRLLKEKGKTIVIITHRLNTIIEADKIIYLENGHVKETGTHTDLMDRKSGYYHLWHGGLSSNALIAN